MDCDYKDIINKLPVEPEVHLYYMNIQLFIQRLIPQKDITDFATRRGSLFQQEDFRLTFLSCDELERVNGYKSLKKQIEWIAGRFLVKNMVKEFVDYDVALPNVKVAYKEEGAPFLEQFPVVTVSITHSGNYAAAALCTTSKKIGIDIEKSDYMPAESFMRIAFTDREIANIEFNRKKRLLYQEKRSNHQKVCSSEKISDDKVWYCQEVMRCWTRKEAFLKYICKGFNEKLKSVEIIEDAVFYNGEELDNIAISTFNIDNHYLLSLIYG
ncbi:MAG: 4'-phosphopantetheinyl transferase superfamily protein [Desulfamplus sp.]|nr:4'-phosphopantetheinyl transferase superfamily protein [Desulfamplus sp.]